MNKYDYIPKTKGEWIKTLFLWPFWSYVGMDIFEKYFHNKTYHQSFAAITKTLSSNLNDRTAFSAFYIAAGLAFLIIFVIIMLGYNDDEINKKVLPVIPLIVDLGLYALVLFLRNYFISVIIYFISTIDAAFLFQKYMQIIFDKKDASKNSNVAISLIGLLCYGIALIKLIK